jgi:hypothetical protein
MTTLTTSIADVITLELEDFASTYVHEKGRLEAAIAKGDFVHASIYMHEAMIWQHNQAFVASFEVENIDRITGSLLLNVLANETNPRAADLARQAAWKEQYKFCVRIQKIIARRAA